jgi:hypothetical protein
LEDQAEVFAAEVNGEVVGLKQSRTFGYQAMRLTFVFHKNGPRHNGRIYTQFARRVKTEIGER